MSRFSVSLTVGLTIGKIRRLAPLLLALGISALAGMAFPFIEGVFSPKLIARGAVSGCLATLLLAGFEAFFYRRRIQYFDMKYAILIKTLVYAAVISAFCIVLMFTSDKPISFESIFTFSLGVSFIITSFVSISRILGQHELVRLIAGRYHRAKEEDKVVMFIDLVGSTTIAEKIGAVSFLRLLNDFIFDITEPILDSSGEIYKYVGDGVIVTWNMKVGLRRANVLNCFFLMHEKVRLNARGYLKKYQIVPEFRAGAHCGRVVIGEMGDFKKEIAILGDTVNTAARIITECSNRGKNLLISEDLLQALSAQPEHAHFGYERLGAIQLKGKKNDVELLSVDAVSSMESGSPLAYLQDKIRGRLPAA